MIRKGSYSEFLRDEIFNVETYFAQICNLIAGTFRLFVKWIYSTTVLTTALAILWLIRTDPDSFTQIQPNMIYDLRAVVTIFGTFSLIFCLANNAGRFTNIFSDRAAERKSRHDMLRDSVINDNEIIEGVLLKYGLLTENDQIQNVKPRTYGPESEHNDIQNPVKKTTA